MPFAFLLSCYALWIICSRVMPFGLFALVLCPLDYLLSCYALWIICSLVMPFGLFALLLCPLDYLLSCYDLWIIYSLVMPFGLFAPKDIYLVFHSFNIKYMYLMKIIPEMCHV
jgi:putative transposon-encoded protein